WAAERELLTALVCRPSALEEVADDLPPDRLRTEAFRRLYEAIRDSASARDLDIASVVRGMDDADVSSLAVELYERGQALASCRDTADTGPGPLERLLEEALVALKEMEDDAVLASRREAARRVEGDSGRALQAFAEARARRQGFLPPSARRGRADDV
ncbi:MAG: hypothetical protein U9R68_09725, partial [Planctomycetota bacterium]|nr:hypothetical protein [Planctomycetota bacterium]